MSPHNRYILLAEAPPAYPKVISEFKKLASTMFIGTDLRKSVPGFVRP